MPSFNNYIFTDIQYTIPEGSNVSILYPTAQITIVPNPGYTATAADFSLDPSFSDNAVQSVVFTQDGLNVLCTVTFDTGFFMPSGNYTIPLCVVGEGEVGEITIGGTISADIGANITGDVSESNTPYANSGLVGETELLLTRSYTAASGYYLTSTGLQVVEGNASNYNIIQGPTYDVDGNLTGISYAVRYTYPNQSIAGDRLNIFQVSAQQIYIQPIPQVIGYSTLPAFIQSAGSNLKWEVFGIEGGSFSASMTDGVETIDIASNAVFGTGGVSSQIIEFPTYSGATYRDWTLTLTGDIQSPLPQANPATIRQYALNTTTLTASSTNGITGFTPVLSSLPALQQYDTPMVYPVSWNLSVPTGTIISERLPIVYDVTEAISIFAQSATAQSNVSSLDIVYLQESEGTLQVGDRFNINAPLTTFGQAPFPYEVTAINSPTNISVSPNITVGNTDALRFYRTNGTAFNLTDVVFTQVDNQNITLDFNLEITATGDVSTTLTLDLDNIINFAPAVACDATVPSGGIGVTDTSVALDPAGGIVCFLVDPIGVPDKFEIIHGAGNGTKVATSGMNTNGNSGPFDNTFGTETTNVVPTVAEATSTLQFIGTDKDPIDTRQTEFNNAHTATGETIPTMQPGGTGTVYKQVLWWDYTAADYVTNPNATFRVTGPEGTSWSALRVCFP
jgi:hypothetical protein